MGQVEKFNEFMAMKDQFEVVRAWHEAVNRGDADALIALSDVDIQIGGPRGSTRGSAVLRDWLARAGIELQPRRWFARSGEIVVEQIATWRTEDGAISGPEIIASSFQVGDGRVLRTVRYDSLESALAATGLTVHDERATLPG